MGTWESKKTHVEVCWWGEHITGNLAGSVAPFQSGHELVLVHRPEVGDPFFNIQLPLAEGGAFIYIYKLELFQSPGQFFYVLTLLKMPNAHLP